MGAVVNIIYYFVLVCCVYLFMLCVYLFIKWHTPNEKELVRDTKTV